MSFDTDAKIIFETIIDMMHIFNHVKTVFKSHVAMSKYMKGEEEFEWHKPQFLP